MTEKAEELRRRVGNSEVHFCGIQKKQTEHIWIEEPVVEVRFLTHRYSAFKMQCKECGNTILIYSDVPR
jgi:DNA-directed RNA polymerase beta' subunit